MSSEYETFMHIFLVDKFVEPLAVLSQISDLFETIEVDQSCCITFKPVKIDMREKEQNQGKLRPVMCLNLPLKSVVSLDGKSSQMLAH